MYKDKIVWITGASSGIGEALAVELANRGARLILSGRRVDELERVAEVCGGVNQNLILPFEVTDYAALSAIVDKAWTHFGQIDIMINNAGVSQRSLAIETDFSVYQKIIDIDLLAPIALTQLLLPRMAVRKTGRFITIASVAGKVGAPLRTGYSAAKHGLFGYFDALRAETAMLGITVHMVAPGSVKTSVAKNALDSDGTRRGESDPGIENGMDPNQVAVLILQAVAAGKREIIIGQGREKFATYLRRFTPNRLFDTAARMMAQGYEAQMRKLTQ